MIIYQMLTIFSS